MSEQAKQGEGQSLLLKTQFHHTLTNTSSFSPQAEAHGAPAPRKQGTIIMIITVILEVAVGCAAINLTLTLIKLKYPHTNSPYSVLLLKNELFSGLSIHYFSKLNLSTRLCIVTVRRKLMLVTVLRH